MGVQWMVDRTGVYKEEGDTSAHAGINANGMLGINPLLRFSKLSWLPIRSKSS
jgi:hypothetical protein